MIIDITYDSSVASCPDEAAFKACVAAVVKFYEAEFNNPITINIDVGWGEVDGFTIGGDAAAESVSNYAGPFTYSQVKAALGAAPRTVDNEAADGTLGSTDPTGGGAYYLTTAQAKALGLSGPSSALDGYIGVNSNSQDDNWDFTTTNSSGSIPFNETDLFGPIAHEFSEVMGRQMGIGRGDRNGAPYFTPLDLFDYSASGVRSFDPTASRYFSIDSGVTNLNNFNTIAGIDPWDWNEDLIGDSYGFAYEGTPLLVTATDLREMSVLGYNAVLSYGASHLVLSATTASALITLYSAFEAGLPSSTGLFLSTTPTVTASGIRVDTIAVGQLAPGASAKVSGALTLPSGLAPGTYYLAAIADYDGAVAQTVRPVDISNVLQVSIVNQGSVGSLSGVKGVTAINDGTLSLAVPLDLEGSLAATGALTVSSTVSGAGTLQLPATTTFASGASLTVAHVAELVGDAAEVQESLSYAGALAQSGGTLTVDSGDQLSLSGTGDLISGTLAGAGTVAFTGGTVTFANAALDAGEAEIEGASATLTGNTTYSALSIASRAALEGSLTIGAGGAFSLLAGGDLIDTPTGALVVDGPLAIAGTLTLERSHALSTTVSGTGTLSLAGGVTTFEVGAGLGVGLVSEAKGATAEVATPSLTYAGRWVQLGGALGAESGEQLTLTGVGDDFSGTLSGPGTIAFTAGSDNFSAATLAGPITIAGAGAVFNGQNTSTRSLTVNSAATVNGTLSVAGALILGAALKGGGSLTLENGTLTARAGAALGVGTINQDFAGVVQVEETSLAYKGLLNAFGGAISVSGGDTLTLTGTSDTLANALTGAGTIVLAAGADTVDNATIALAKLEIDGASTTISGFTTLSGGLDLVTAATQSGTLEASGAHANLSGAGVLTLSSGIITAASGATLTSSGTIEGAGTVGSGFVNAAHGLIQATASGGLTLGASGSTFVNVGTIGGGADLVTVEGALANSGLLVSGSGGLSVLGAVTGAGTVQITASSAYFSAAFGENVAFVGSGGTLGLSQADAGTISGLTSSGSDGIDLGDLPFVQNKMTTSYSGTASSGVLTVSNGTQSVTLHFSGDYRSAAWAAISDNGGNPGGNTFLFSPVGAPAGMASAMAGFSARAPAHATAAAPPLAKIHDLALPLAPPHAAFA